jgi:flagellar hook-basal body complex protein FliE
MVSPLIAAKAYAAVQGSGLSGPAGAGGAEAVGSPFAALVQNAIEQTVQTSRAAEVKMTQHVQGKAELIDVVTAVSSAEASLETAMAIRDQVIAAYQEIMRMPI